MQSARFELQRRGGWLEIAGPLQAFACRAQVTTTQRDCRELQRRSLRIASVKAATRHELLRRVLLAADFIWSNYEQAITLDDIAGAARLSRFHLVRLFRQVHGVTPHGYLIAKRLAVAERMLAGTQLDLNDIALRAGFGTRWSLFRHLRRRRGAGGDALRHRHEIVPPEPPARIPSTAPCLTSA